MNQQDKGSSPNSSESEAPTPALVVALFWLFVGLPLAWGIYHTVAQATQLFR